MGRWFSLKSAMTPIAPYAWSYYGSGHEIENRHHRLRGAPVRVRVPAGRHKFAIIIPPRTFWGIWDDKSHSEIGILLNSPITEASATMKVASI